MAANYAALVAEWATITANNPGFTTAQKLNAVNTLTVSNVPNATWHVPAQQVWECIVLSEFMTLTQPNRMEVYAHLGLGFVLIGGATAPTGILAAVPFFGSGTCPLTYAKLVALAQSVAGTSLWVTLPVAQGGGGLTGLVTLDDLVAAGGLT